MIEVHLWPIQGTRSPERSILWEATAQTPKGPIGVQGRMGLCHHMARALVDAGVPDGPMQVYTAGKLTLTFPSIHKAALRHVREDSKKPIQGIKWSPPPSQAAA